MAASQRPLGTKTGYRLLEMAFRLFGYGFVSAIARAIVFYYFLFSPRAVASSMRFYEALFPEAGVASRWAMAWRQFKSFTTVFLDRFFISAGKIDRFDVVHDGLDSILKASKEGRPVLLWMAHLGNWEVACHALSSLDVPISLVMGKRQGERIESIQKEQLAASRIKVVIVSDEKGIDAVELIKSLKDGGIVAISGDRLFDGEQRSIEVGFLGRRCRVPIGPYVLSSLARAEIFPIFGVREARMSYRMIALESRRVEASSRSDRQAAMERAAQSCFDELERMVRAYPDQWYNFFDIWAERN